MYVRNARLITVLAALGLCLCATAAVPTYEVGMIPGQTARLGTPLSFFIYTPMPGDGLVYGAVATPAPAGALSIDPLSGLFTYTPAEQDRKPFQVVFSAAQAGKTLSQTVVVEPQGEFGAESEVLSYVRPLPDPTSYTEVAEEDITENVDLNHIHYPQDVNGSQHFAKRVSVTGRTVIFDKNAADLYSLNGRNDILELTVAAETIIVRDPVHLPQTDVTLYARELRFEDRADATDESRARFITTPRPFPARAASASDTGSVPAPGAQGLPAGNITAHVGAFVSLGPDETPSPAVRFDLSGGQGQKGGAGKPGAHGQDVPNVGAYFDTHIWSEWDGRNTIPAGFNQSLQYNITYYHEYRDLYRWGKNRHIYAGNAAAWKPGTGGAATPDAKPGTGGVGGLLQCPLSLDEYANVQGGPAGPRGDTQSGGTGGNPRPAWYIDVNTFYDDFGSYFIRFEFLSGCQVYWSPPGADASPLPEDSAYGPAGTVLTAGSTAEWLHPAGIRAVLQDIKAAYLAGHIDASRERLAAYLELLSNANPQNAAEALDFEQLRQEMEALYHRASSNLDYFGNPAGWVPMLSLESNFAAFQNEIGRAIRVLYATYWLSSKADEAVDKAAAMTYAKGQLDEELNALTSDYEEAQAALPALQVEADNIAQRIPVVTEELKTIDTLLLQQAQDNLEPEWWQKALKVVGAGLKMLPVGQPYLGSLGGATSILATVDGNTSWDDIGSIVQQGEFAYVYRMSDFVKKSDQMKRKLKDLEADQEGQNSSDKYRQYVDSTSIMAKQIADGLGPLVESLQGSAVPQDDLRAEVERLRAADPAFQKVVAEIEDLMLKKEVFGQRVSNLLQRLSDLSTGINQTMLASIALDDNITQNAQRIDDRAFMYIGEMETRARDRLLKYQYYMAKAYEYRMLRAYDGQLDLDRLFDAFKTLVQPDDHLLTQEEFDTLKAVYLEELSRVMAAMFDELNVNAPERSVPITFSLTADELTELNETGQVRINLMKKNLFGRTEENVRLVNLRTFNVTAHAKEGNDYGGTALLRLKYEHSGQSLLSSRGRIYSFNHYRSAEVNPITWKTVYDLAANRTVESTVSAASQSLIRFLLEDELGAQDPDLMLYSRPAAWADIVISKEEVTATGVGIDVDKLQIQVDYDYFEKRNDLSELTVCVSDGLRPVVWLDAANGADVNGRRDGRGDFVRVFSRGESVAIEAPSTYGTWVFERWEDVGGAMAKSLATGPRLALSMSSHKRVRAVYRNTADVVPPPPPVIATNAGQSFTTGFATATLTGTASPDTLIVRVNGATQATWNANRTQWTLQVPLEVGLANYAVTALDQGLNESAPAVIPIYYLPAYDADDDGLADSDEQARGTDSYRPDTDGDGMPDGWEIRFGLNPLSGSDASLDGDQDGSTNGEEYLSGTDPLVAEVGGPANPPVITNVEPQVGLTVGGTPITVTGQGFQAHTRLYIGDRPVYEKVVVNPNVLTAFTPAGVEGWADVRVANAGDDQSDTLSDAFRYTTNLFDAELTVPVEGWALADPSQPASRVYVSVIQVPVTGATTLTTGHGVELTVPASLATPQLSARLLVRSFNGIGNLFPVATPELPQRFTPCGPVLQVDMAKSNGTVPLRYTGIITARFPWPQAAWNVSPDLWRFFWMDSCLDELLQGAPPQPLGIGPAWYPESADPINHSVSLSIENPGYYMPGLGTYVAVPCDLNSDLVVNALDLQRLINVVLQTGVAPPHSDLNEDGFTDAVDIQALINAMLGL